MIKREYPDIEFVETDTETIENSLIALWELMYEKMTGKKKKVQPASPERLYIAYTAAVIIQQRIIINETAKKNVPRYATGKYLDSLGELFKDTFRLPEAKANAIFRFYISEPQKSQSVIVPKGTRINFDGEIVFSTVEELEIPAGATHGDVMGECLTPGIVGNNIAAGQIKEIVDTYDYFLKVENITRTAGGADTESDQSYYERLRDSMESFSTAGPDRRLYLPRQERFHGHCGRFGHKPGSGRGGYTGIVKRRGTAHRSNHAGNPGRFEHKHG